MIILKQNSIDQKPQQDLWKLRLDDLVVIKLDTKS